MSLLRTRRFLPLFLTQFLGALNDNLLKNALVMLVTYRIAAQARGDVQLLVTLAAALFILPFFLFSATAGQLADKYDRARLTQLIKLAEIIIMAMAAIGFMAESIWLLMFALFAMGVHSTFFGPIKYALLPQHLREGELLPGNAYIEAGTFLAILLGTILGGLLVLQSGGVALVSAMLLGVAALGYAASRFIPDAPAPEPSLIVNRHLWQETWRIVGFARGDGIVFGCILGISWFWLVGGTFLSQFAPFVKDTLHAEPEVVTLFLTMFSLGIGAGSLLCNRLLRGHICSTYVPWACASLSAFGIDLYFASQYAAQGLDLMTLQQFLGGFAGRRIAFDLFMIAVSAGVYIVPLYALLQHRSEAAHRARIIAANNIVNALFMVASALATLLMLSFSFTIAQVFLTISWLNGMVAFYVWKRLRF